MMRQATFPLLFVLSPNLQADPAAAIERRVRRAALRRAPVLLGTLENPYEPAREASLLAALLPLGDGLKVEITTASPRILNEIELLADLDRRHSVTVRMVSPVPAALDPGPRLRAAQTLASEGITTVLVLVPTDPAAVPREEHVRFFLAAAREAEVHDVALETQRLQRALWEDTRDLLRRLRLEYGFPQRTAGRG
jgi:DNA repair photolyase